MDAQDIIELIEYFRNSRDSETEELKEYINLKFDELYERLTEYMEFNYPGRDKDLPFKRSGDTIESLLHI